MALTAYTADGRQKNKGQSYAPQGVVCSALAPLTTGVVTTAPGWNKVPFPRKDFDPFNLWDAVNYRFQPKIPGYYDLAATVATNCNANGPSYLAVRKNGAVYYDLATLYIRDNVSLSGAKTLYFNGTTDYAEFFWYWAPGNWTFLPATAGVEEVTHFSASLVGVSVGVAPEPRHIVGAVGEPAFANGWVAEGVGTYMRPGFLRDPNGIVHLQGTMNGVSATAATLFTLPVGYRPEFTIIGYQTYFPAGVNPKVIGEFTVQPTGAVGLTNANEAFAANMRWAYFETHYPAAG